MNLLVILHGNPEIDIQDAVYCIILQPDLQITVEQALNLAKITIGQIFLCPCDQLNRTLQHEQSILRSLLLIIQL